MQTLTTTDIVSLLATAWHTAWSTVETAVRNSSVDGSALISHVGTTATLMSFLQQKVGIELPPVVASEFLQLVTSDKGVSPGPAVAAGHPVPKDLPFAPSTTDNAAGLRADATVVKPSKRRISGQANESDRVPKKVGRKHQIDTAGNTQVAILATQVRHPQWQDTRALAVLLATADNVPALRFPIVRQRIGACLLQVGVLEHYRRCVAIGTAWELRNWPTDARQENPTQPSEWAGGQFEGRHRWLTELQLGTCRGIDNSGTCTVKSLVSLLVERIHSPHQTNQLS